MIIWLIVTFGVWVYGRKDRPKDGPCFFLCFEALTQNLELKPSLFQLILGPMYMVHISTFIHVKSSHPTANLEPCDISGIINPTMTRNLGPVWFNGSSLMQPCPEGEPFLFWTLHEFSSGVILVTNITFLYSLPVILCSDWTAWKKNARGCIGMFAMPQVLVRRWNTFQEVRT